MNMNSYSPIHQIKSNVHSASIKRVFAVGHGMRSQCPCKHPAQHHLHWFNGLRYLTLMVSVAGAAPPSTTVSQHMWVCST
jgi:hypothetical protein